MWFQGDTQKMELDVCNEALKTHSDKMVKFAKVSKFRSIGVFHTLENANQDHVQKSISDDDEKIINNTIEKCEFDAIKQHLKSGEVGKNGFGIGHAEISKLFNVLLDLKLAYVKLQEAHVPYDPKKIRAADRDVVENIYTLSNIKKAYKEKLAKEVDPLSARSTILLSEIQVKEKLLEKLKYQVKNKDKELSNLRQKVRDLGAITEKLAEEVKNSDNERDCRKVLNHEYSFENAVLASGKAIHEFAKPLISLMKASGWDLDRAVDAVQESVIYAKRSHKKYAFEAYIARRMFHDFSSQPRTWVNVMNICDPIEALVRYPQSDFAEFVKAKYLLIVHPDMEVSFFGNLDHRTFVSNGIHPCTPFYRAFVRMAKQVWYLLRFSMLNEPKAEVFGVKRGSAFSDLYMDVVDELKDYKNISKERCKVEFMIMPGFKLGNTLIKAQVYVS